MVDVVVIGLACELEVGAELGAANRHEAAERRAERNDGKRAARERRDGRRRGSWGWCGITRGLDGERGGGERSIKGGWGCVCVCSSV